MNDKLTFDIKTKIGVLSTNPKTGWSKEINIVSWNDRPYKYEIRDWDPEHEKMSKGISLTETEVRELARILNNFFGGQK